MSHVRLIYLLFKRSLIYVDFLIVLLPLALPAQLSVAFYGLYHL